jgi:hypothetical protein
MRSIRLGSQPAYEATSDPDRYLQIIRAKLGAEIGSTKLVIQDGSVYCLYADPKGAEYAVACRDFGPVSWGDTQRIALPVCLDVEEVLASVG